MVLQESDFPTCAFHHYFYAAFEENHEDYLLSTETDKCQVAHSWPAHVQGLLRRLHTNQASLLRCLGPVSNGVRRDSSFSGLLQTEPQDVQGSFGLVLRVLRENTRLWAKVRCVVQTPALYSLQLTGIDGVWSFRFGLEKRPWELCFSERVKGLRIQARLKRHQCPTFRLELPMCP